MTSPLFYSLQLCKASSHDEINHAKLQKDCMLQRVRPTLRRWKRWFFTGRHQNSKKNFPLS